MPICWKCRDTGVYRVARLVEWLTAKGPQDGYRVIQKPCDCKAGQKVRQDSAA